MPWHPMHHYATQRMLLRLGLKSQVEDSAGEALERSRLQEEAFLTNVTGPESPQSTTSKINVERHSRQDPFVATAVHRSCSNCVLMLAYHPRSSSAALPACRFAYPLAGSCPSPRRCGGGLRNPSIDDWTLPVIASRPENQRRSRRSSQHRWACVCSDPEVAKIELTYRRMIVILPNTFTL